MDTLYEHLLYAQRKIIKDSKNLDKEDIEKRILTAQKPVIYRYETNPFIANALSGKQKLLEKTEELAKQFRGINFLRPYAINEEHNKEVDILSKLIPSASKLVTRGSFFPDNLVAAGLYSTFFIHMATQLFFSLYQPVATPESMAAIRHANYFALPPMEFIFGPLFGLGLNFGLRNISKPLKEAVHIDHKIHRIQNHL